METNGKQLVSLKIYRGNAHNKKFITYELPIEPGQSVLNAIQYIADYIDPTLTFTCSCRIGLCSGCLVRINGKVAKSCTTLVEDGMVIEPYKENLVFRDIVSLLPSIVSRDEGQ